ncbi:GGDEF and EAL domain-containing protein [Marinomonas balearica]|uniref:GGDEF and EAL domain-containing protein n=1 Tax=Marinomonas balearica TaxID=491947 RepID=UPI001AADB45A|nr:GGDEF and EAL domain-containing protein [Marinomonas balearica]
MTLIISTVFIMSVFVAARFHFSSIEFDKDLNFQIAQSANRIGEAVKPAIWTLFSSSVKRSFSDEFSSSLLDSELQNKFLKGIVVYSQFGRRYMGRVKVNQSTAPYSTSMREKLLSESDLVSSYPIKIETMTFGRVELFIDLKDHKEAQFRSLMIELLQIGIVSIFFVFILYFSIKKALAEPVSRLQVARKTFESMGEGVVFTNSDGYIYDSNPAFLTFLKTTNNAITNKHIDDFLLTTFSQIKKLINENPSQASWTGESECLLETHKIPVWLIVTQISSKKSDVSDEYAFIVNDISEDKEQREKLRKLAYYDVLTGLPNRQFFEREIENRIQEAKSKHRKVGLIFIDLDNFKHINDGLGHESGDIVITEAGTRLQQNIKEGCFLARLGGDEFTIIADDIISDDCLETLANNLIKAFHKPFIIHEVGYKVSISVGLSTFPTDAADKKNLIKNSDIAMYNAKRLGKSQYSFFSHALNDEFTHHLDVYRDIESALEKQEFTLYFQPKIDLIDDKIVAAEALIRWIKQDGSLIRPDKFIPIAEETKQIIPIGEWVIQQAIAQLLSWKNTELSELSISVNLSTVQLYDENIVHYLKENLQESGIRPDLLEIEITESSIIKNMERAIDILNQIKSLGVKLSLDDFGTGYSSLSYLQRLPVDTLKIDRSFIATATKENVSGKILKTIIELAQSLSMEVVAEGVEDIEHHQLIVMHHCQYGQGYYYSPPMAEDTFERYARDNQKQLTVIQ